MSCSGLFVDDECGLTFEYIGNADEFMQFYYEIFRFKFYDSFGICKRALQSHVAPVVVDVGANVGLFGLRCFLASNQTQLFAIEPGTFIKSFVLVDCHSVI